MSATELGAKGLAFKVEASRDEDEAYRAAGTDALLAEGAVP